MKVFISWSKDSRKVGAAMSKAVKGIFSPGVDTFISQEIRAGARGLEEIDTALNDTDFGIICLTRVNQTEQWINYEAGALSRQVEGKRQLMGVFLVDIETMGEVQSPLNIFQCKFANLSDFSDLMKSLNGISENPIEVDLFEKRVASVWDDLNHAVQAVKAGGSKAPAIPEKTAEEKLDEVLGLVKSMEASLGDALPRLRRQAASGDLSEIIESDASSFGRLTAKILLSQRGDETLSSILTEQQSNNPDILNATISDVMEDLSLLGDWGDMGSSYDGKTIVIRSQKEIPDAIKTMLTSRIRRAHPRQVVSFKIKTKNPAS